ncbi:MAG: hypothetical protein NTW17_00280, partial [Candidatus Pacearchaeota archaeon]|nr:hypothetical protein [Candidatus Pacearchaeota archaeon]
MEEKRGYTISDIYQGGYSSITPPDNNYITAGSLGTTTDPRSANILQEVSSKLSSGVKNIEVEGVSPEVFDSIPTPQLKEVHRLSKLTGIDVSIHAPVMDVSGIDPRSGFSEGEREAAERRVSQALLRSHELNPDGNINVNFHSAEGIPGSQFLPPGQRKENEKYKKMIVVNRDTGKLAPLETEKEFHPGGEVREITKKPEQRIDSLNSTEWRNSLFQIEINRENAERIMKDVHPIFIHKFAQFRAGVIPPEDLSNEERAEIHKLHSAYEFIEQAKLSADSLFSKAYEFAKMDNDEKRMNELKEFSKRYGEAIGIEGNKIKSPEKYLNPKIHSEVLRELAQVLEEATPKLWVPVEDFAAEKSSQTFGNAAWDAYKKLGGKNVPILTIENPPAGFALSTGEGIKKIVEESRKKFIENAMKPAEKDNKGGMGMSESQAREEAEKLIGATWDVGHINMLRKYGYTEKDII